MFRKWVLRRQRKQGVLFRFQAAIAALADQGIKRVKVDHKWVQAEFNGRLIKKEKGISGKTEIIPDDNANGQGPGGLFERTCRQEGSLPANE